MSTILSLVINIPAVLIAIGIHEASHGFTAYALGDKTAKREGRLTLNPFSHIDPIGFICLLAFGFGWAKPVPVNRYNFRKPKRDMAITALAGPVSNFLLALISLVAIRFLIFVDSSIVTSIITFLQILATISIGLGIFNLIPIHPFDGYRIFESFLPMKLKKFMYDYQQYIQFGFMIALFMGVLDIPLYLARNAVYSQLFSIAFIGL